MVAFSAFLFASHWIILRSLRCPASLLRPGNHLHTFARVFVKASRSVQAEQDHLGRVAGRGRREDWSADQSAAGLIYAFMDRWAPRVPGTSSYVIDGEVIIVPHT